MRRNLLLVLLFGLSVAILAVAVLFLRQRESVTVTQEVEQVMIDGVGTREGADVFSGIGSLRELSNMNRALECQVIYTEDQTVIEGTFFTVGGSTRGDFLVPAPELGGRILSSTIMHDGMLYAWSIIDGQAFGYKTALAGSSPIITEKVPVPLDGEVRYSCSEWATVDRSVFIPPQDVVFQDSQNALEAGMEYGIPEAGL